MRVGFMNTPDDCQWLRETHLKGVALPTKYADFKSFVLQGNEDAPHAVNLYVSADPLHTDTFLRFEFVNDGLVYAYGREYDGATNRLVSSAF